MQQLFGKMLLILCPTILFCPAKAQKKISGLEISAGPAIFVYQGDLTPQRLGSYRNLKPGFVLSAAGILSNVFAIRINMAAGSLRGDETKYDTPEFRKFRAFKFRSPVIELTAQIMYAPFGNYNAEKGVSPYFFGGAGLGYFNTRRDYSGYDPVYFGDASDIPQRIVEDEQQPLRRTRFVAPVGAGLRYNISHSFAVNAETAYRFVSTDYLDGFSQAANPERNDHYQTFSTGLIYRLGNVRNGKNQTGCPVIRY